MGTWQEASDPSGQIRANITFGLMYHQAGLVEAAAETLQDALMYADNIGDDAAAREIEQLLEQVV